MIELEVWNSGKTVRQGDRLITEVIRVRSSSRPNTASTYEAVIPAEVDNGAIINGNELYIYVWQRGIRLPIGGGEITDTKRQEVGDGGIDLTITGLGLLNELNYVHIPNLKIRTVTTGISPQIVFDLADNVYEPNANDGNPATSANILMGTRIAQTAAMYIGHSQPHWDHAFDIGTANAVTADADPQYVNPDDWVDLTLNSDGTDNGGATMGQDGTIDFDPPGDWLQIITGPTKNDQMFWVRYWATATITANINEVTVTSYDKDTSDINTLHTAYPAGMTLQTGTGYYTSTSNGYFGSFSNMSALQAWRQLADTELGIFRLSAPDTRTIQYLRDEGFDKGYTAIGPAAPSLYANLPDNVMLITGINRNVDTGDEVNRLHPYGAGSGYDARTNLSLADETQFATDHSGYTLDADDNYIEKTTVTKRKEAGKIFPDVRTVDGTENSVAASEQLANSAFAYMDSLDDAVEHLNLELIQLPGLLQVGDRIRVVYKRLRNASGADLFDIDDTYTLTRIDYSVTNGVLVCRAVASTINRPPKTADELLYNTVEQLKREQGQPQRVRAIDVSGQTAQVG